MGLMADSIVPTRIPLTVAMRSGLTVLRLLSFHLMHSSIGLSPGDFCIHVRLRTIHCETLMGQPSINIVLLPRKIAITETLRHTPGSIDSGDFSINTSACASANGLTSMLLFNITHDG